MSSVQSLIDRQLGIYCRLNYDDILKRLVVDSEESFYGLQSAGVAASFEQDPPIFACRFAESAGYEHILAIANEDGRVAIQDTTSITSARVLNGFQCHNNAVFDLAWMPGNMNFVTVSGDHTASLWDINEGAPKQVLVFSNHTRSVKTAVFPPNKPSVFATGARDGHILVWDIRASGQPSVVLKPDNSLISCHSCFTPKTPGSHGKRPRIDHRAISITGLVFQDDLTLLSSGECDGNIKAWDLRKNYNIYKREPLPKRSIPYCGSSTKNGYTNLIIDDARTRLYASCMDGVIYCFNVAAYAAAPERRYVGHENSSFYIKSCLSADCAYLVSGSGDNSAYVWNVKRSEPLVRLSGHRAEVTCAAWCRRGDVRLVTCSDDARHNIWRIGRELPDAGAALAGRAEPQPRRGARAPRDRSPASLERKASAERVRVGSARKTKRCLADLMNASAQPDEAESAVKRLRFDNLSPIDEREKLLPAGIKRRAAESSATDRFRDSDDRGCVSPTAGASFVTPTKKYEACGGEMLSRKRLADVSPSGSCGSPEERSPKRRIVSFGTPTKDLPNFVISGEAPHLRLMSPVKKRPDGPDWLTRLGRDKRWKRAETEEKTLSEKPAVQKLTTEKCTPSAEPPARRRSESERTPRTGKKPRTLLKYFNVTTNK